MSKGLAPILESQRLELEEAYEALARLRSENASLLADLNKSEQVSATNRELILLLREAREAITDSGCDFGYLLGQQRLVERIDAALASTEAEGEKCCTYNGILDGDTHSDWCTAKKV